jgi:hypothetical protein
MSVESSHCQNDRCKFQLALREIVTIGAKPYRGMGGESKRELRERGQRMLDAATAVL